MKPFSYCLEFQRQIFISGSQCFLHTRQHEEILTTRFSHTCWCFAAIFFSIIFRTGNYLKDGGGGGRKKCVSVGNFFEKFERAIPGRWRGCVSGKACFQVLDNSWTRFTGIKVLKLFVQLSCRLKLRALSAPCRHLHGHSCMSAGFDEH